jgi:Domain of unknown function (DUF4394)/PEP-CTERM motif
MFHDLHDSVVSVYPAVSADLAVHGIRIGRRERAHTGRVRDRSDLSKQPCDVRQLGSWRGLRGHPHHRRRCRDDFRRPANGLLYGLGSAGNLFLINPTNGSAILNASLTGVNLDQNATRFGIDFNPTVDRLRVVSNTGENLRLNPDTGATTIDGPLNGAGSGAVSVAYTNNDNDPATATKLFYIGSSTPADTFSTLDPNGGVLNLVGALGVSASQDVGFDISGRSGLAFASLSSPTGSRSSLYTIDLTSGAATLVGTIGVSTTMRGIALSTRAIPEPTSLILLGVGSVCVAISTLRQRCRRSARK